MPVRLLCLAVLLLLPRFAFAQESWDPPGGCRLEKWSDVEAWREWNSHTPADNSAKWTEEKPRYAERRDVWRWLDRLYIEVQGGKVLTLADCAFGDDLHFFLYERYDEAGGFHVVHVWRYEDHSYALVMRETGKIHIVPGLPVWSPDRARFAYAVCDALDGTAEVAVMSMADQQPTIEARAELPCTLGDCQPSWDGNTVVSATCGDPGDRAAKRLVMRRNRGGDGWASTLSDR